MPNTTHTGQSMHVFGEQNVIVHVAGDGNSVVLGRPHLRLTRDLIRRQVGRGAAGEPDPTVAGEREADVLLPHSLAIPFCGRVAERKRLEAWLDSPARISAHVLIGPGGRGKTRLALEICEARASAGVRAGFVTPREFVRFRGQANLAEWGWNAPTLVVVDNAASLAAELHAWLSELADHEARLGGEAPPLRLLILERSAVPGEGWWAEAFGRGGDATAIARLLDSLEPDTLAAISDATERRDIFLAAYRRLTGSAEAIVPHDLDRRLSEQSWCGEPLFLAMAGLQVARLGIASSLALPADQLAFGIADRELNRIGNVWIGHGLAGATRALAVHLAAVATLREGLSAADAHLTIRTEKVATRFDTAGDPEAIRAAMHVALPGPDHAIAPIQPDILGEAVLLRAWRSDATRAREAVMRAYRVQPDAVASVVVQTCQDFLIRGELTPLAWLHALCEAAVQDPSRTDRLAALVPADTVEFREIAADLAETRLALLGAADCTAPEAQRSHRAGVLNDLSRRLSSLGRREAALAAGAEAVELYRHLAAARPDAFRPALAGSLNNLSVYQSDLGRREAALAASIEAVEIQRALVAVRPDTFRPDFAGSLSNLSLHLSGLGERQSALAANAEAVEIYRDLAGIRPDTFRPALASSLNNLSARLAGLGRREAALAASTEAVKIYRDLADIAFRPDLARSLNNLSHALSGVGQRESALAAIAEAVEIYRDLVAGRPDAIRPDLARSLHNLANRLSALGRREAALAAIAEAVEIYRDLAAARPEAIRPDLARSLHNLAIRLSALGRREAALAAITEAVAIRRDLAATRPDAFRPDLALSLAVLANCEDACRHPDRALAGNAAAVACLSEPFMRTPHAFVHWMRPMLQQYLERSENLGREPNYHLLKPIMAALQKLQLDGQEEQS